MAALHLGKQDKRKGKKERKKQRGRKKKKRTEYCCSLQSCHYLVPYTMDVFIKITPFEAANSVMDVGV